MKRALLVFIALVWPLTNVQAEPSTCGHQVVRPNNAGGAQREKENLSHIYYFIHGYPAEQGPRAHTESRGQARGGNHIRCSGSGDRSQIQITGTLSGGPCLAAADDEIAETRTEDPNPKTFFEFTILTDEGASFQIVKAEPSDVEPASASTEEVLRQKIVARDQTGKEIPLHCQLIGHAKENDDSATNLAGTSDASRSKSRQPAAGTRR